MRTSIAKWENKISITKSPAPKLPNPQGKHVPCINGCGNEVSENVLTCRSCRRKAKLVKARAERKIRKTK